MTTDKSFAPSSGLMRAIELLDGTVTAADSLPEAFPDSGFGEDATLTMLAHHVLGGAAKLDAPDALAHMDPPTPWITWAMAMWNARLNQNLLHPATSPFAREAEQRVIDWLCPFFGMHGGHLCSGSTIANLTALWAARDAAGATSVITSDAAHLSVRKAATILGMGYREVVSNEFGALRTEDLGDVSDACLVLTAGTTCSGAIDNLRPAVTARWTHVDAAWAGPLRFSQQHAALLDGIECADSISLSAHKWLFQPKDSGLVLFREPDRSHEALSFPGSYLVTPNIGVQGSRGAAAVPLLATLLAWGRDGVAARIDRAMEIATEFHAQLKACDSFETWNPPVTGVNLFRPVAENAETFASRLPAGMLSMTRIGESTWLRSVAANPLADIDLIMEKLLNAAAET